MTQDKSEAYLRARVLSAKPEELRLMLIEGAIKFVRQGREGLAEKNYERSFEGLSRSKNILLELVSSLRPEVAPDLCENLSGLYMFMYRRLIDANIEKNPAICDEVIELLEYDRQTWLMLMEKLREERGQAPASPEASAAQAAPQPARARVVNPTALPAAPAPGYSSLSIEG